VKERPRSNHRRPSVAVRFFSPFSFLTSDSRVAESVGVASYLARTFYMIMYSVNDLYRIEMKMYFTAMLPFRSLCTRENAADPSRSKASLKN
jgi:hypothetical protein